MTYYPTCIALAEHCNKCNTGESFEGCANGVSGTQECSAYCNSGCNVVCNSLCQAICNVHGQFIKDHKDVGAFPGSEIKVDDFIHEKWSATFWNSLIGNLNTAETVGAVSKQVAPNDREVVTAPIGNKAPYTASLYNQVRDKIKQFSNIPDSYKAVNVDDLITATVANAIRTAYNSAKFSSTVCDICNSGTQHYEGSSCTCNCSCTCACACSCSCDCPGCSCSGCSCSCSSPNPSPK